MDPWMALPRQLTQHATVKRPPAPGETEKRMMEKN